MAQKIANPFLISGYESPRYFCDREKEAADLLDTLYNGRNITLTSPRRLGKTGLIKHIFYRLKKRGETVIYIDLYPTESLNDFTKAFASAVLGQLDSNLAPGTENSTIEQVFNYLKQSGKTCYIAFDEFQQIAYYPEKNVEALLRSHIQDIHNIHFIFSGSRRHMLGEMFLSPKRPFYQSTSEKTIDTIDESVYYKFASAFFEKEGRHLPEEIFHIVYSLYEGYTWYIQMIMNRLFAKTGREIDKELVQESINEILKENEFYYQHLLHVYPKGQVKLVKAIAKEGKVKAITAGSFIMKYGLTATSSVKSALARMLDEEIVYPSEDGYMVYDRFFAQWLDATF